MSLLLALILIIVVSIDGFIGGFSFGARNIKMNHYHLFVPVISIALFCMIAMYIGGFIRTRAGAHIEEYIFDYIGSGAIVLLGIMTLKLAYNKYKERKILEHQISKAKTLNDYLSFQKENPDYPDYKVPNIKIVRNIYFLEIISFSITIGMSAALFALALALQGEQLYLALIFAMTHFAMIGSGNVVAIYTNKKKIGEKIAVFTGVILVVIGILRIL